MSRSSGTSRSGCRRWRGALRQDRRIRDGRLAGEALADVDGRLAVDLALAVEERDPLGGPERDDRVRVEACKGGAGELGVRGADDRQLARGREVEVERAERVPER